MGKRSSIWEVCRREVGTDRKREGRERRRKTSMELIRGGKERQTRRKRSEIYEERMERK